MATASVGPLLESWVKMLAGRPATEVYNSVNAQTAIVMCVVYAWFNPSYVGFPTTSAKTFEIEVSSLTR